MPCADKMARTDGDGTEVRRGSGIYAWGGEGDEGRYSEGKIKKGMTAKHGRMLAPSSRVACWRNAARTCATAPRSKTTRENNRSKPFFAAEGNSTIHPFLDCAMGIICCQEKNCCFWGRLAPFLPSSLWRADGVVAGVNLPARWIFPSLFQQGQPNIHCTWIIT